MKKIFLFGNWKMNQSLHATKNFVAESAAVLSEQPGLKAETEICIFPPFVLIPEAVSRIAASKWARKTPATTAKALTPARSRLRC